ncbi:TlpA disulfide reductase family protein [Aliiglaciecola litoralis]|uniref:TlpA disulfide reductase family protein n=1 Tax=Aliiglaciecola litoralis TaxID=582857 RepID=A0ABN1LCF1_9ALTE
MLKKIGFALLLAVAAVAGFWFSLSLRADFSTLDGKQYSWQSLKDQIVVVNYFAEWCAPCLKEVPELNKFAQFAQQNDGVSIFAVNFDNLSDQELSKLRDKYSMEFAMVSGLPKNAPFAMPKSLPATFIIGSDGTLIKQLNGEQTDAQLQNIVLTLQKLQAL